MIFFGCLEDFGTEIWDGKGILVALGSFKML